MAGTSKKAKSTNTKSKATNKVEPMDLALDAMASLVGKLGWQDVTLSDIAEESGLGLAGLRRVTASKAGLLEHFVRRIDEALLNQGAEVDPDDPPRDRLFDIMMKRFDLLQPHRDFVRAVARDMAFDPLAALCLGCGRHRSSSWMLEVVGLSTSGMRGALRAAGLNAIFLSVMRTWLKDESKDMSATMAHLDRQLGRADKFVNATSGGFFRRSVEEKGSQTT